MKILKVTKDKHVKERFYVKVEGLESFPVSAETVARYGLNAGAELDRSRLDSMLDEDEKKRAMLASLNLLGYSQRSRRELAGRLKLKSFTQKAVDHALERLTELGYINDTAFAKNLLGIRRSQGKGDELIKYELKRKGIPGEIITETIHANRLSPQLEADSILPLMKKKLSQMRGVPAEAAARRLAGFLARRGFSLETARTVLKMLRAETPDEE